MEEEEEGEEEEGGEEEEDVRVEKRMEWAATECLALGAGRKPGFGTIFSISASLSEEFSNLPFRRVRSRLSALSGSKKKIKVLF